MQGPLHANADVDMRVSDLRQPRFYWAELDGAAVGELASQ